MKFPNPMNATQFERTVKDRAAFSHEVVVTDHARERMLERDISQRQLLNVLRKGAAISSPKWDPSKASYVATMSYVSAGAHLEAVCAIRDNSVQVFVITAF